MSWVAVGVGAATLVGGIYSSNQSARAGRNAANAQEAAALAGVDEQARQFDAIRALLEPYVQGGARAVHGQTDLLGINGNEAQQAAIDALKASPAFTEALKTGETSILSNASATGGLRGGNTQSALAQFSPRLLAATINDRMNQLGGLASLGQNAAAGVGNAGMSTGRSVADLLGQAGAAQAGGILAGGRANIGYGNALFQGIGAFGGLYGNGTRPPNYGGSGPGGYAPDGF